MDILKVKVNGQWVGIPAIKGDTGATGPQGPKGDKGADGESIIPVFTNTNDQWSCNMTFSEVMSALQANNCEGCLIDGSLFAPVTYYYDDPYGGNIQFSCVDMLGTNKFIMKMITYMVGEYIDYFERQSNTLDALAKEYSSSDSSIFPVSVGDYYVYNGKLCKANTAIPTAESFKPAKWDEVKVTGELETLTDNKAPVIVNSASGAIASFSDGAEMPVKDCTISIESVQSGSGDPSQENIRPITGWTGVNVTHCGSNLFDPSLFGIGTKSLYNLSAGSTLTTTGTGATISGTNPLTITNTTNWRGAVFFSPPLKAGVQYRLRYRITGSNLSNIKRTYYYVDGNNKIETNIANDTSVAQSESYLYSRLFTPTKDGQRVAFIVESSTAQTITIHELRFNFAELAEYEPYSGTTYPISWETEAGTVYGGSLDVTTGVLTVTDAHIASYNGETLPSTWISDRDVYDEGETPTTGAQVVYKLATPVIYQLTPTEIYTMLGQNNIWADCGDISVDYCADTKTYVDQNEGVKDVQINGASILNQGVAYIPYAVANSSHPQGEYGIMKVRNGYDGLRINPSIPGRIELKPIQSSEVKAGTDGYVAISAAKQHEATFYGLAKAAGDTTQAESQNPFGYYTVGAKSKISQMLNGAFEIVGATPSFTALPGVRYVCGECTTLTIVAPASGCFDVKFTSGSTPTVLTVTSAKANTTIKWANGFDPTSLDADTTYEINILDGEFGVVGSWT